MCGYQGNRHFGIEEAAIAEECGKRKGEGLRDKQCVCVCVCVFECECVKSLSVWKQWQ